MHPMVSNSLSGTCDKLDAARFQKLNQPCRHERQVDNGQIGIKRTEARHEMEDIGPALVVGHVEGEYVHVGTGEFSKLANALLIGAVADASKQSVAVDPHEIAALKLAGRGDFADDRNAQGLEIGAIDLGFEAARGLPMWGRTRPRGVITRASWV